MQLDVTSRHIEEMTQLLLDFGERHDLSMAECCFAVTVAISQTGYLLAQREEAAAFDATKTQLLHPAAQQWRRHRGLGD